jgi:hypothetical protein
VEGVAAKVFMGKEVVFVLTAVGYDGTPRTGVAVMFESTPVEGDGGAAAVVEEPPSKRRKKAKAGNSKQKQKAGARLLHLSLWFGRRFLESNPHDKKKVVVGTVVDGSDGTYRCSYTPTSPGVGVGEWQFTVQIGGVPFAGSPFALEVGVYV